MVRLVAVLLLAGVAFAPAQKAQDKDKKAVQPTVRVTLMVQDPKGRPFPNASVVMKQVTVDVGRMPKHAFTAELHTDEKGQAVVQGFDTGVVLVQVIAHGYQTYGQEFIMKDADETVHVKLSPPKSQVTIYH
ncbi:MAG TPA: carboxypeptidase-like regulatory domain-containing protein [Terriglobales bacterium]|nr:carboxypeptidase-like regulatory domain-containing protein [Terriglobales bacterium]